jgi:RNA polymerase sigma-70 factor (ECF subfamily)
MRSYDGLRDPQAAKAWMFTIATNCARDRWRARGRELDTVPLEPADPDDEFSLFATIAIEDPFPYSDELHLDFLRLFEDADLQAVFASLTPAFRAPILLTTIHGFSCRRLPSSASTRDAPVAASRGRKRSSRDYGSTPSAAPGDCEDEA